MKEFIDKLIEKLEEELIPLNQEITKYFYELKDTDNPKYIYSVGRSNALTDFKYTINQLAEEYKVSEMPTGWIPCSINKHNEIHVAEEMWVTMRNKDSKYCFVRRLMWNGCLRRWEWDNGKPISDMWEVVAWKKIDVPAPYTEGE